MPFGTKEAKYDHRNRSLRVTNLEPDLSIEGECLLIRGGHIDQVSQLCDIPVPRSASVSELEEIYRSWRRFVQAKGSQLSIDEYDGYTDRRNEKEVSRLWTRFLTVHYDEAKDLETPYGEDPPSDDDKLFYDTDLLYDTDPPEPNLQPITLTTQALVDAERDLMFRTKSQINLRLSFCHLLPSSASLRLHPNHRIHAGLRLNGPGRRLCITKRGFIALVPANSVVGDSLAVLQGASFAYVLRKQDGGEEGNLLVGEAFVPRWAYGMGEDLAMEWGKGIDEVIRIY
ncbi:hypothetical protein CC78DRAFT_149911 [Lojkania enalia]|uniref:Uncharacterized protein n=1 Tax=Lojkania enalia TaxID=147567 RepID=A0A9P4KC70_9PLEO|nr:hypothetical protein CC78DRAFT_149911 [Didymosphaeria enalia]